MIVQHNGKDVEVFMAKAEGGHMDAIIRADSREIWEQAAVFNGLASITDEGLMYRSGVAVDHIGPVVITEGAYDDEGQEITAPVFDKRHHLNLRLSSDINWQWFAIEWTMNGEPDKKVNREEQARKRFNIALIDPASIKSPARVWA